MNQQNKNLNEANLTTQTSPPSTTQEVKQLSDQSRRELGKNIEESSQGNLDFLVMISFSTLISTLGLILDSSAVIIGAMLVAPLMKPIMGLALALIHGGIKLFREALSSVLKGIFLAILLSFAISSFFPFTSLSTEVMSRIKPNLLDLLVAFIAGLAGSYAICRENVSESLPGVAISAALVPPLSVVGIGLALENWPVAMGALVLFFTNLVAITLAGALIFRLFGYKPTAIKFRKRQARKRTFLFFFILAILIYPLYLFYGQFRNDFIYRRIFNNTISKYINYESEKMEDVEFKEDLKQNNLEIIASISSPKVERWKYEYVTEIEKKLEKELDKEIIFTIRLMPVEELTSNQ